MSMTVTGKTKIMCLFLVYGSSARLHGSEEKVIGEHNIEEVRDEKIQTGLYDRGI